MHESAALAQRLARQLGGDLDRILPPAGPTPPPIPQTGSVELRQIGGLTAGGSMPLAPGRYEFGQTSTGSGQLDDGDPDSIGFTLDVDADGSVTIWPGTGQVRLDDLPLTKPALVGGSVIDAGSARFLIARPRPPVRRHRPDSETGTPQLHEATIPVPELGPASPASQSVGSRLARMFNAGPGAELDSATLQLLDRVRAARGDLIAQRRRAHPDTEEILARARVGQPLIWTRQSDHWHFGQVTIALGDVPWRPRFDRPDRIPGHAADAIRPLHVLPSAPMTADLRGGPLGVVGSRPALLAVARHVMLSLATLSPPEHLELAVLSGHGHDWAWADALPHTRGSAADGAMPVLVVDGMSQLDDGIGAALTLPGGVGAVLLTEQMDALPPICATVLLINDDGTCTVIDHRDGATTMGAAPLGLPLELATTAAAELLAHAPITI